MVLYAIVCPELNSSGIHQFNAQEQYLLGNTFPTDAEITEMATPFSLKEYARILLYNRLNAA